jgi:hypothetical protein
MQKVITEGQQQKQKRNDEKNLKIMTNSLGKHFRGFI